MIDLPPPIAPWRTLHAILPPDLAAGLGPLVERLVLAVGPLRASRPRPGGEPDGFSGITRRGSYERLLLSEWLLADELPEEFARRATMGEHAFHDLARRTPSHAASSVALFDAGPDQLGSPRIVHLAALLTLAERAERAGARFAWGLLHDPESALFPAVTAESALNLLGARTAVAADADVLRAWSTRARKSGWEDVWIVGRSARPRAPGATWEPASIEAHDVLDPARRAVRVIVSPPSSSAREIDLDLPDEPACARLLRNPFQRPPPPPRARVDVSATSNLVFAPNGGKLFARGHGNEILAYPVPTSSRITPGRPKRYVPKSSGYVVAVGWINRMIVMLVFDKGQIRFEIPNGKRLVHRYGEPEAFESLGFAVPGPSDPLTLLAFAHYGPRIVPVMIDARGALYEVCSDFDPPISRVAPEVAALAVVHDEISFVGRDVSDDATIAGVPLAPQGGSAPRAAGAWLLIVVGTKERQSASTLLELDGFSEAIYGFDALGSPGAVLVAVRHQGSTWRIETSKRTHQLDVPDDVRVVGVHQAREELGPELIVLECDKREISFIGRSSSRSLPRASSDIVHVAQCHSQAILAYATVTGEVVIHALGYDAPLARYLPNGGA